MNRKPYILALLLMLVLTGCGAGAPDGGGSDPGNPPPGNGEPPPAGSEPFAGRIIADGNSAIHTIDLPGGSWAQRLDNTVYDVTALRLPANELAIAGVSLGSPLTVAIHNLKSFALKRSFVWPESDGTDLGRVEALAISPDGRHAAAYLDGSPARTFLEIIDIAEREVVHSREITLASERDLQWLDDERLVMVLDLNPATPELAGAIAAVSLDELIPGDDSLEISVLVGFSEEQWTLAKPHSIAFSHDLTQIAFSYQGDIWAAVVGESPHQLTYGPTALIGPTFSPGGTYIAFSEDHRYGPNPTFVIPNHRDNPYFVDGASAETQAYMLEDTTLVETMLVWLP